jgi:hypothetical protein
MLRTCERFFLWKRGYIVVPGFVSLNDCEKIRNYLNTFDWPIGAFQLPHGSFCSSIDQEIFDFKMCLFDELIRESLDILVNRTGETFTDVGLRTIQLRMHSPIWHIDMQTFNNDYPLIARDKRFKVYKCGIYLQDEAMEGGGTIEIRQPFIGGGIKNLMYLGNLKKNDNRLLEVCVKGLGLISDWLQIFRNRPHLCEGDLIVFNGALMHRASQRKRNDNLVLDEQTNYFIDTSDERGKMMLQWELINDTRFAHMYRDHAILKHKLI